MGRGGQIYLSYTALVLLTAASSTNAGLWTVNIDESPAPSPQDGPPFSAHASRNRALLPYQIIGIVGAYMGSILIIGTLLLTVGRSLRKKAQRMALEPKEMVKPSTRPFETTPVSPQDSRSWYSPRKVKGKKSTTSSIRSGGSTQRSPAMSSMASFDNKVFESDRARDQEELGRLYAAAFAHDERKASQQNIATMDYAAPPEYSGRSPPRLITDAPTLRHLHAPESVPVSPGTSKSPIRAIYPPQSQVPPGPVTPTSPIKAGYPNYSLPSQAAASDTSLNFTRTQRAPSYSSIQSGASTPGPNKLRKSLRNIKISGPIMKDDNDDGARTPLSPRFYTDPGIPPEPPAAGTTDTATSQYNPGAATDWNQQQRLEQEEIDQIRHLPQPNPQRFSGYNYNNVPQVVTNAASTRADPTRIDTASSTGALPLREMNRQQYAQQTTHQAFPLSATGSWNQRFSSGSGHGYITSAGPVKTTFLEARRDRVIPGPQTAKTPYSPYMPFTPLTPVTPRLTSRAERKQREKEEKRHKGVITEEDAVVDERELWSSGY